MAHVYIKHEHRDKCDITTKYKPSYPCDITTEHEDDLTPLSIIHPATYLTHCLTAPRLQKGQSHDKVNCHARSPPDHLDF